MSSQPTETQLQRSYYEGGSHLLDPAEGMSGSHDLGQSLLLGFLGGIEVSSLLDVGAGTGRMLARIKATHPGIAVTGIEPSAALRAIGVERWGLAPGEVVEGDATNLPFADRSIDVVSAFGILHHIRDHARAVSELTRVARKAVVISDVNCYGQGSWPVRRVKRALRALRLWDAATWLRSGGKGYFWSEGDGIYYSYSLIDDLHLLNARFRNVILANASGKSTDHYRDSPYLVAIASDEHL